jgi:hypothetical protein
MVHLDSAIVVIVKGTMLKGFYSVCDISYKCSKIICTFLFLSAGKRFIWVVFQPSAMLS